MFKKEKTSNFHRYRDYFSKTSPNRSLLLSVLMGDLPGELYVMDSYHPESCFLVTGFYNWSFVSEKADPVWLNSLIAALKERSMLQIITDQTALIDSPLITEVIPRCEFSFNTLKETFSAPKGQLVTAERELMERSLWKEVQERAYGSLDGFLKKGKGLFLVEGEEILCEAYATFFTENLCELGVITPEKQRGKGYAFYTCASLISRLKEEGIETLWSADSHNHSSVELARKLSYTCEKEYYFLYCEESLISSGNSVTGNI